MESLPSSYASLPDEELCRRIDERKSQLGRRLVILGHHYQRDEVIRFADYRGDSLKLSQLAAGQKQARYIVFCGVHFMAESADILSGDEQTVCLPNRQAGCAMADMADEDAVATAIDELNRLAGGAKILPVTYVNSTAAIKAVTAQAGGACCTSSNVRNVFQWALQQGPSVKIFAVPDEHLARNTAEAMGYDIETACAVYDPTQPDGGLTTEQIRRATFLLWRGFCYVHQLFKVEHVAQARRRYPHGRIIVHPECPREVVAAADDAGSTSQIIRAVEQAPPGSTWVVGTEGNLVHRLAAENPDKTVALLSDAPARCVQMSQIDLPHLLWCLDAVADDRPVNVIRVDPEIAHRARLALERMIATQPENSGKRVTGNG